MSKNVKTPVKSIKFGVCTWCGFLLIANREMIKDKIIVCPKCFEPKNRRSENTLKEVSMDEFFAEFVKKGIMVIGES